MCSTEHESDPVIIHRRNDVFQFLKLDHRSEIDLVRAFSNEGWTADLSSLLVTFVNQEETLVIT